MASKVVTSAALAVFALGTLATARTSSQFQTFFPAWDGYLLNIIENKCTAQHDAYVDPTNQSRSLSYELADCILNEMAAFHTTEMSITSVVLGLLPTMLQHIGPTISEVSVLAVRRPLLALLLGLAMPSVRTGGPDPAAALDQPVDVHVRSGMLARRPSMWLLISALEYLVALAAVANVFYQAYQLAYWSVSVSAIAIDSGSISQTYSPFLWLILLVPMHLLGLWAMKLRYHRSEGDGDRATEKRTWLHLLSYEFTPCAVGHPLKLKKAHSGVLYVVVKYWTDIATVVVFIYGTVALSSQIFISLGDVVPVIARYLVGAIACRIVLSFELHGLREAMSQSVMTGVGVVESSYGAIREQDDKTNTIEQSICVS